MNPFFLSLPLVNLVDSTTSLGRRLSLTRIECAFFFKGQRYGRAWLWGSILSASQFSFHLIFQMTQCLFVSRGTGEKDQCSKLLDLSLWKIFKHQYGWLNIHYINKKISDLNCWIINHFLYSFPLLSSHTTVTAQFYKIFIICAPKKSLL